MMPVQTSFTVSWTAIAVAGILLLGTGFQVAHLKTAYNLPLPLIEKVFNETTVEGKENLSGGASSLTSTVIWSLTVAAEPLGAIPAFLTGRNIAEIYGRSSLMLVSFLPSAIGLILQGISHAPPISWSLFITIGRLLHSFGVTWLTIGCVTFVTDLLKPKTEQSTIFSINYAIFSGFYPLYQVLTLPFVLGSVDLWPWLNVITGIALISLTLVLVVLPESPRYLYSIGELDDMQKSLDFYRYSKVSMDQFMGQILAGKMLTDWDRRQGYTALKVLKRQKSHQLNSIYITILCAVIQCLLMSNVVFFLLVTVFREGMGHPEHVNYANYGCIGVFMCSFTLALMAVKVGNRTKTRGFRLVAISITLACYLGLTVLGFLVTFSALDDALLFEATLFLLCTMVIFYNLGVSTLSEDLCYERLIPVAQGPTFAIAMSIGKFCELLVSGAFFPVMRYAGVGYAWLIVFVPAFVAFCGLLARIPHDKRLLEPSLVQFYLEYPGIQVSLEEDLIPPGSVSTDAKVPRAGRFKYLNAVKPRARSVSPLRPVHSEPGVLRKLTVSKSAYLQQKAESGRSSLTGSRENTQLSISSLEN